MIDEDIDLGSLRRTSTRAGLLSLVGALIVFAGLAYGGLRLRDLQDEVTTIEARIAELRPLRDELEAAKVALTRDNEELARVRDGLMEAKADLEEERLKLSTEIESLRSERDRLREGYQTTLALTSGSARVPTASRAVVEELRETMPISAVARPRASREPLDRERSRYSVWLELPAGWSERCERVSYVFNHASFRAKNPSSTDASDGFRVSYVGWGCLDSVVATVTLKNGAREKIVFDMCALLSRDGEEAPREPPRATVVIPKIDARGDAAKRPTIDAATDTADKTDGADAATDAATDDEGGPRPIDAVRPKLEQRPQTAPAGLRQLPQKLPRPADADGG